MGVCLACVFCCTQACPGKRRQYSLGQVIGWGGTLVQQQWLPVLVFVQKPGIDDGLVGVGQMERPRIKPPPNDLIRDVVPALRHPKRTRSMAMSALGS